MKVHRLSTKTMELMFAQLTMLCCCLFITVYHSKATNSNSGVFTIKESYRNNLGIFLKSNEYQTMLSCGHACLRHTRCTATNFRFVNNGRSDCELVDTSVSDLQRGLEFARDWVFSLNMKVNADRASFAALQFLLV